MSWYDLPPEIWANIFAKLHNTNEYSELVYDTHTVYSVLLTCEYFLDVMAIDSIWMEMCQEFPDFDRLEFMHQEREISWREIYQRRVTGVVKTKEIRVGDQNDPENTILFQIHGNGNAYISSDWSSLPQTYSQIMPKGARRRSMTRIVRYGGNQYIMVPIREVSTAITTLYERDNHERSILDRIAGILPFTRAGRERRDRENTIQNIRCGSFIDISAYSPYVLLLSKTGVVFEFMFLPQEIQSYEGMYVPKEVRLPVGEDEKVIYVKATAVANYAITNKQRIFAWTMFDDPGMHCKRAAIPVEIVQMRGMDIKKIKQLTPDHTIFHRKSGEMLNVSNNQIFYLIVQEYLT